MIPGYNLLLSGSYLRCNPPAAPPDTENHKAEERKYIANPRKDAGKPEAVPILRRNGSRNRRAGKTTDGANGKG